MNVNELELLRKKARNRVLYGIVISILIGILFIIVIDSIFVGIFVIVVGIIVTTIFSNKIFRKFTREFKNTFVLKSLQNSFDNLVYEPEKGLDESIIRNTQMMYMGDRYSSNDLIYGTYKNINILQADVHIEEEHQSTDSDGNTTTSWVTIFMGRWMIFDFNKAFKANIQVSQRWFGNSKINNWGVKTKYKKVMMEDQAFNNEFKVYAQSEHEAFYILTPQLMDKIKNLADKISGKILLCFIDNKLHVGIQNNKDSFEHSVFTKINEEKVMNEISRDIKLITDFVDELDLDNDLFIRKEV